MKLGRECKFSGIFGGKRSCFTGFWGDFCINGVGRMQRRHKIPRDSGDAARGEKSADRLDLDQVGVAGDAVGHAAGDDDLVAGL